MNREIKFRFWEKLDVDGLISFSMNDNDGKGWKLGCNFYKDTDIAMQYTGLLDKNGKEIYEGDIIHLQQIGYEEMTDFGKWSATYEENVIEFVNGAFRVNTISLGDMIPSEYLECWVIGNIYQNPELLTTHNK